MNEQIAELVERLRARRNKVKDYGANGWFETLEEDGDCNEAAASLVSLSERLAKAEQEIAKLDRMLDSKAMTDYVLSTEVEHRQLAEVALAEARTALEPFAKFADALNEAVPDDIALGIFADGAMRFGPSGDANLGSLRRARATLNTLAGVTNEKS